MLDGPKYRLCSDEWHSSRPIDVYMRILSLGSDQRKSCRQILICRVVYFILRVLNVYTHSINSSFRELDRKRCFINIIGIDVLFLVFFSQIFVVK